MEELRKIIHVDMDAFYASVEQMDDPSLKGMPVAVGGSQLRGVVAAASYEARKYGVRSAMPSSIAARKCPDLIFVKPRFERYQELSRQIRGIFSDYTDLIEPLSLDEAYLDVTHNKIGLPSATLIAQEIRKRIKEEVGLTASAGVSFNKFLAKTASDMDKPDGLTVVLPHQVEEVLDALPIERFFGVGKVTAEKLHSYGVRKGSDLKKWDKQELVQLFGKQGAYFYQVVRGIDNREVQANRVTKSVAIEDTFNADISEPTLLINKLEELAILLEKRLSKKEIKGKTLTLKIKYNDFSVRTRSQTVNKYLARKKEMLDVISKLLLKEELEMPVRLIGIQLSNLNNQEEPEQSQLTLDF